MVIIYSCLDYVLPGFIVTTRNVANDVSPVENKNWLWTQDQKLVPMQNQLRTTGLKTPFRKAGKVGLQQVYTCTHKAIVTMIQSLWLDKRDQIMLNWQTEDLSSRQFSSDHFPREAPERTTQFWDAPPSGWGDRLLEVSQFLYEMLKPVWSTQVPSFIMSLTPSQICSLGPMLWRM